MERGEKNVKQVTGIKKYLVKKPELIYQIVQKHLVGGGTLVLVFQTILNLCVVPVCKDNNGNAQVALGCRCVQQKIFSSLCLAQQQGRNCQTVQRLLSHGTMLGRVFHHHPMACVDQENRLKKEFASMGLDKKSVRMMIQVSLFKIIATSIYKY